MATTQSEPFVKRFEMATMQYVILSKAQEGEVTRDNLKSLFKGNLQMSGDHFDHCINQLVQDGHIKEIGGNKYQITDDGREDVNKLQNLVVELPNVGGQKTGQRQPATAGGYGAGTQAPGQPKGGPGSSTFTGGGQGNR